MGCFGLIYPAFLFTCGKPFFSIREHLGGTFSLIYICKWVDGLMIQFVYMVLSTVMMVQAGQISNTEFYWSTLLFWTDGGDHFEIHIKRRADLC